MCLEILAWPLVCLRCKKTLKTTVVDHALISHPLTLCMLLPPGVKLTRLQRGGKPLTLAESVHQGKLESVLNCYQAGPIAGLPDMTTLNSSPCEKILLDVVWSLLGKKRGLIENVWAKKVSSGSYLDADRAIHRVWRYSNTELFFFLVQLLFLRTHHDGWLIWEFLVFDWSYWNVQIPLDETPSWNCVHSAISLRFQTFQMHRVEQISLLPVIPPIRQR